jgi:DNA-directed RNA polymerase specialized sigma24 family protein
MPQKVVCDEDELVRLYVEENKKQHEVAKIMGISTSTVCSILKRRKVKATSRSNYKKSERNKERDKEIVRLFAEENLIPREISENLGLAITIVREIIEFSGATKTDAQIAERKEQKVMQSMEKHNAQQIVNMHEVQGMTITKIANEKGINHKTVSKILGHMRVETRSPKDYEHDKGHLTKDRDDEIVRLYEEEHFSSIQVSRKMNLNKSTILRILEKRNVKTRSSDDYLTDIDDATKAKIVDLFNEGKVESDIAEELQTPEYLIIDLIASHKRGLSARVLSDSEEIELLKRYLLGETREELAEEYGISTGSITNIQDRQGQGKKLNHIDEEMQNKIIEMYFNEKKSSVTIEKESGIRIGSLRKMRWSHISDNKTLAAEDQKVWCVVEVPPENTKTGRWYELSAPIVRHLERLRQITRPTKKSDLLFTNQGTGAPLSNRIWGDGLKEMLVESGLAT